MEAVKKAASGAVESIRNSPLFRRKFGTYQKAATRSDSEEGEGERGEVPQPLSLGHHLFKASTFRWGIW